MFKKVIKKLFYKKYRFQSMVQFYEGKPVICGDHIRWMELITIYAFSENKATEKALKKLNNKYPLYDGKIQIFLGTWEMAIGDAGY